MALPIIALGAVGALVTAFGGFKVGQATTVTGQGGMSAYEIAKLVVLGFAVLLGYRLLKGVF